MMRIISLVPSLSELICELKLQKNLVGCTAFCMSPKNLHKTSEIVGGPKNPNLEHIKKLKPSHIIVNQEENKKSDIESLKKIAPTLVTFPKNIIDIPFMIEDIASFLHANETAQQLANKIKEKLYEIEKFHSLEHSKKKTCYYFIWKNPWMLASYNTYIDSLLNLLGFYNLSKSETRYPKVELENIFHHKVDAIFLPSEPWPFRRRDLQAFTPYQTKISKFYKIDGKLMSWYGSSSYKALCHIQKFLNNQQNELISDL